MRQEVSMPPEWVSLLMDKNIKVTYMDLQEMTCGQVYDLLELQSCFALRSDIIADVEKNRPKN